ncbi:hypothetical protein [Methylobacterium variabile]|uniref:hypothetical protein n=1 Tax=Methylobacterium variabile TaxID=298794 RepID=UPI0012ED89B1|nr:hypothetical protein [Methylobacterium variabile]
MREPDLLDALRRFAAIGRPVIGPCPGSNFLPVLEHRSDDDKIRVSGEELERMLRAGLLTAIQDPGSHFVVDDTDEYGGIDADHLWSLSPAGRTALDRETEETGR